VVKRLSVYLILFYKHTLGIVLAPSCRFHPTCSNYAIQAIRLHGVIKGVLLTAWRLLRCNPLCSGGWDPVPVKMKRKDDHE
jgi:putative membrane protein insertion efficiency factor